MEEELPVMIMAKYNWSIQFGFEEWILSTPTDTHRIGVFGEGNDATKGRLCVGRAVLGGFYRIRQYKRSVLLGY